MQNNNSRWFDWFSAILLGTAFATVTIRMRITEWTPNMDVLGVLAIIGVILGIMLGASRFTSLAALLFAVNYSIFFIPWQLGLLVGNAISWDERLLSLIGRLSFSINEVANNRPVQDSLLFLTSMSIFFWILAIVAGYQLARHGRPWGPVMVLGLTLAIVDFYTPYQQYRDRYSGFFVFILLLLAARLYLLRSKNEWLDKGMAVDPEIGYDLGRTVAISGLVLVMLAWNVPTLVNALTPGTEIQKVLAKQWESVRNRFQNAVAGLQNPVSVVSEYFGPDLALGTGGAQGDEIVFTVQTQGSRPENVRFYWKARTFDLYDGTQWKTSLSKMTLVPANEWPFRYPQLQARQEVSLILSPKVTSLRNIYAPGIPLQISRPVEVLGNPLADGTTDVIALSANPSLRGGEVVRLRSWVSSPTILGIKQSSTTYTDEMKRLYLQLPAGLPSRIPALAREITKGLTNPYDQVTAITNWLRKNITYADTVPAAPQGRDILDWFLFDLRKGYCNYYASSEVVMLRSLGIPTRLAVGYAEGESEKNGEVFTVRRRDSHAWPEVYFPGYGWIEFEPTASQPGTALPEGSNLNSTGSANPIIPPISSLANQSSAEPTPEGGPVGTGTSQNNGTLALIFLIPAALGLAIAGFLWLRRTHRLDFLIVPLPILVSSNMEKRGINPPAWLKNWSHHLKLTPMQRMFARVNWMLFLMGRKSEPAQTPAERITELIQAEPRVKNPANDFLEEYQNEEYSPRRADYYKARDAHRLMWRIVTAGALRRLFSSFST